MSSSGPKRAPAPRPHGQAPWQPSRREPQKTPSRLERQGTGKIKTPHPRVEHTNNARRGENPIAPDGVVLPVKTRVLTSRVETPDPCWR